MLDNELEEIIKEAVVKEDFNELVEKIISHSSMFENYDIEKILQYMDIVLKKCGVNNIGVCVIFINNLSPNILKEHLPKLIGKLEELYSQNLNSIILENIITSLPDEAKIENYGYLVNFITNGPYKNKMQDTTKVDIIGNLNVKNESLEDYNDILKNVHSFWGTNNELINKKIQNIEYSIIKDLPEEIKMLEYDNLSKRLFELFNTEDNSIFYLKFANTLSSDFIKSNYERILKYFSEYNINFNEDIYYELTELLSKLFSENTSEKIDNNKTSDALIFTKNKMEEICQDFDNCKYKEKIYEAIIKLLPINFVEANTELCKCMFEQKFSNSFTQFILSRFNGETISKFEEKINIINATINIDNCKGYFEYLLLNTDNAIVKNDFASSVFNFINSQPHDTRLSGFRDIIKSEMKKHELIDMSIYDQYIPSEYSQNINQMDAITFKEFCNNLEKLKFLNKYIPEKYCDFLISQKLNCNSHINQEIEKYLPLLKRAFEDKTYHILKENNVHRYQINFSNSDEDLGEQINFYDEQQYRNFKSITFGEKDLRNLDILNTNILNTMYHEIRHAIQDKKMDIPDPNRFDASMYNIIKDKIIREKNEDFYRINYRYMYHEIDARVAGAKGQAEYLYYLGIAPDQIIENNTKDKILLKECYEHAKNLEEKMEQYAFLKKDSQGNMFSIHQKTCEIIENFPSYIKKYPILELEFNKNGKRKSTIEILENAILQYNTDNSINEIFKKIFESDIIMDFDSSLEFLNYASKLLSDDKYSKQAIEYINLIIKNQTPYGKIEPYRRG